MHETIQESLASKSFRSSSTNSDQPQLEFSGYGVRAAALPSSSRRVLKVRVPPRTLEHSLQSRQAALQVPPVVFVERVAGSGHHPLTSLIRRSTWGRSVLAVEGQARLPRASSVGRRSPPWLLQAVIAGRRRQPGRQLHRLRSQGEPGRRRRRGRQPPGRERSGRRRARQHRDPGRRAG